MNMGLFFIMKGLLTMALHPLNAQMSIIEGYYDDGQEFTKINLIDEDTYTRDKHLLNIIQSLYDKQNILDDEYNVNIPKNMYDYINCYIYKHLKLNEVLQEEHFTYLDIFIYDEIKQLLPRNDKNQFPSYVSTIYFIDNKGVQAFGNPTQDEVIESIKQLIKHLDE